MNLWRLEWLRLLRTKRLVGVFAAYLFCGLTGPLLTKYQEQILKQLGGGMKIEFPPVTVAALVDAYVKNAAQIGLIVAVATSAGALAIDAKPEWSVFLRTRVAGVRELIVPRFAVSALAVAAAFVAGGLAAWYETAVLLHAPNAAGMLAGTFFGAIYYTFVIAVVAWSASVTRGGIGAVALTLGTLIGLPVLGLLRWLAPWMPSYLVSSMTALSEGARPVSEFLQAAGVTVASTTLMLWLAIRRTAKREV